MILVEHSTLSDEQTYSIADLASEFGVTPRAIRFYEDRGLIAPKRAGQSRIYSPSDRARLSWILRGKRTGFSLSEIGELLDLYLLGDGRLTQAKVTLDKCRERISNLETQRQDIDETIAELGEFCDTLETMIMDGSMPKTGRQTTS